MKVLHELQNKIISKIFDYDHKFVFFGYKVSIQQHCKSQLKATVDSVLNFNWLTELLNWYFKAKKYEIVIFINK